MKTIILEDWQVKNLREYFGQNDSTQTSHWAFPIFDKAHKEQLTSTNFKQQRELLFCGGCGNKKQLIVETDINSQRVCKNKLCKQNNCG